MSIYRLDCLFFFSFCRVAISSNNLVWYRLDSFFFAFCWVTITSNKLVWQRGSTHVGLQVCLCTSKSGGLRRCRSRATWLGAPAACPITITSNKLVWHLSRRRARSLPAPLYPQLRCEICMWVLSLLADLAMCNPEGADCPEPLPQPKGPTLLFMQMLFLEWTWDSGGIF